MNPQAYLETMRLEERGLTEGFHHCQTCPDRALGVVFMGRGIAEVHQPPITEILGDVPLKAPDDLCPHVLILPYKGPPLFGVELGRERSRADQVTEHHRELAALRFRG